MLNDLGPAEKGDQLMELLALPRLGLGVVALSALNLHAEKHPAGGAGDLDRVAVLSGQVVDRGAFVVDAGRGNESRDDLAPGPILADLLHQPIVEQIPAEIVGAGRSVVGERVSPIATPVDGVGFGN